MRVILAATAAAAIAVTPSFLLGAVGFLVRDDIALGEAALGVAVASFFVASMSLSVFGGVLSDRLGAARSLRIAMLISAASLATLGLAGAFWHVIVSLVLGGFGHGLAQPATNLAIVRGVPDRQGLAFGVKQAAVPAATLLAGAAVPTLALRAGWRSAFFGMALLALVVVVLVRALPSVPTARPRAAHREGDAATPPLALFALAISFALAAATALGTFAVESLVSRGISPSIASMILVGGSIAGITARLVAGDQADRHPSRHLVAVSAMLAVGALGYLLLALSHALVLVLLGMLLAYGFGWGWNGLAMFAVVRLNRNAPGAASGIALSGAAAGAAGGPLVFGLLASRVSFAAAWTACSAAALIAAVLMLFARRWLLIDRASRRAVGGEQWEAGGARCQ